MVFSAKSNNNNNHNPNPNNNEGWGMGFLFIFFHNNPDDDHITNNNHHNNPCINKKKQSFPLSPSSLSSNVLLSKTQSTLSICGLLVFTTFLLFTLSTFEPTTSATQHRTTTSNLSRRFLIQQQQQNDNIPGNTHHGFSISKLFGSSIISESSNVGGRIVPALQGMGELYMRGSKAMTDLVVGHVGEDSSEVELRTFLRLIQHSGVLSRSDLVFVFHSPVSAARFGSVLRSECDSFLRLVQLGKVLGERAELGSGLTGYMRVVGEGEKEALWGKRRGNSTESGESTRPSYGSVVGFDSSELDPEDTLSGFLDHVPMSLRRWACYPMLLGRLRRNFKHMMLVDVKNSLLLSDPFSRVRNKTSETVLLWSNSNPVLHTDSTSNRHGRRNNHNQEQSNAHALNPGVIIGGSRGVRRFANAALTEIVRVIIEHKGKGRNSVTESGLVNQLVRSGHLLKNINLITSTESIPNTSILMAGFKSAESGTGLFGLAEYVSVVQREQQSGVSVSYDVDYVVMKAICSSHKLYSTVYNDCLARQMQ